MNGRVYDPLTAQFFSPDPILQAPGDWLNYNRYGYCMNNPTRYIDPSGYKLAQKNSVWYAEGYLNWMRYSGGGGGSSDRTFDWYSAYSKATISGFIGGTSEFLNQYDKQFDTNTNGTMTFRYSINHFVGKSHFENGNYVLPELIPVGYSIEIKIGKNSNKSLGQELSDITGFFGTLATVSEKEWNGMSKFAKSKYLYNLQKSLKGPGIRNLTKNLGAGINGSFKGLNVKLGIVSGLLIAADVYDKGEIRPSHVINGVMTGIGLTGWGAPIAAGYFLVDMGMGVFYKGGLSGYIDDNTDTIYDFK